MAKARKFDKAEEAWVRWVEADQFRFLGVQQRGAPHHGFSIAGMAIDDNQVTVEREGRHVYMTHSHAVDAIVGISRAAGRTCGECNWRAIGDGDLAGPCINPVIVYLGMIPQRLGRRAHHTCLIPGCWYPLH